MQNPISLPPELEAKQNNFLTISLTFAEAYNLFLACYSFVNNQDNSLYARVFIDSLVEKVHDNIQEDYPEYHEFCDQFCEFLMNESNDDDYSDEADEYKDKREAIDALHGFNTDWRDYLDDYDRQFIDQ
jgi:hypothetical protein